MMVAVLVMDRLAALISPVAIDADIAATVIIAAKNYYVRWRWRRYNYRASSIIHISNTPGKNSHRCHAKHGHAHTETKPPHVIQ